MEAGSGNASVVSHRFSLMYQNRNPLFSNNSQLFGPDEELNETERCDKDDTSLDYDSSSLCVNHGGKVSDVKLLEDGKRTRNDCIKCAVSATRMVKLDGKDVGDIPAVYKIPEPKPHDFCAVGVWIDARITPGFKYKVRPLDLMKSEDRYLFNEEALELQSIGRGYARRITFVPPRGMLNDNPNYFWSDSNPFGFAFELEVVSVGDKYMIYGLESHPVGHLEILKLQAPQEEISHTVFGNGTIKKCVKLTALAEVNWYYHKELSVTSISGTVICIRNKGKSAVVKKITNTIIGNNSFHAYTLIPGIDSKKRCLFVNGAACGDVPITYTITGLETYELPVIGTYLDPHIITGFFYRVRPVQSKNHLFGGRALCLLSIGRGYGKRITFAPEKGKLNDNENYFWTDSWPDGFGFELRVVHCGMKFNVYLQNQRIGEATVFRADKPQYEERQILTKDKKATSIVKYVHVEFICYVTLNISGNIGKKQNVLWDEEIKCISGTAITLKKPDSKEARVLRIENVGLDSQLNMLFQSSDQDLDLILVPK